MIVSKQSLINLKTYELRLRCRAYAVFGKPRQTVVNTRCIGSVNNAYHRYPFVESVFDGAATQPYIHNCTVSLHEGGQINHFCVFFKRHCRLPINESILRLSGAEFRGEAMIMRIGGLGDQTVVNMRGRDSSLSDYVISR